jgi:integrating conjugative element protein (TIGR03755 family)
MTMRRDSTVLRHLLMLALSALVFGASAVHAQTVLDGTRLQGSVLNDQVLYTIGGGHAVSMSQAPGMRSLSVGIGWNSNLICGDMSIETTLQNQLNGITEGFQQIMSDIIQSATAAVASLPALIIQRADPGLYNLLTNGILQARLDFDRSKLTCRQIADRLADLAGGQIGWDQLAEGLALRDAIGSNDAVSAIEEAETSRGNGGVPWLGGDRAGGQGQEAIRIVGDITRAGYNLVNGRDVADNTAIDAVACADRLTCRTWPSPDAAAAWAVRVLGEQEQRTCESCTKTRTVAGVGLTPLIQEEYEAKVQALQGLVNGTQAISVSNLEAAGSTSVPITRGVIEALRDEPDQDMLGKRLASEAALSSVLEKALLLQRTLLTGRKEPNVAANELAQTAIGRESALLQEEILNLKTELELRRVLNGNSPLAIIQREETRSDASRGIPPNDPERNRLDQVERRPR